MLQPCSAILLIRPAHCIVTRATSRQLLRHIPKAASRITVRRFVASSSLPHGHPSTSAAGQSGLAIFAPLTNELERLCPRFEIEAENVEILRGPVEFYEALKAKILKAQHRIYLSTLYIGKSEHELISTIHTALTQNPHLHVSFLVDALRGTRETPNPTTASLLAPLIADFGADRVQIRLYHTPNLTGLRKRFIPKRINEGWGLQHMKLYGVDDEIILSGANLSSDYFTNRQDRYHVFRSKPLADYYETIHAAVSSISFDVQPSKEQAGYSMAWPKTSTGPSPLDDPSGYIAHAEALLGPLIAPPVANPNLPKSSTSATTLVFPLLQFTPLLRADSSSSSPPYSSSPSTTTTSKSVHSTELPALTHLLTTLRSSPFTSSTLTFTSGYFNPSPTLTSLLLSSRAASLTVIGAAPEANGFYGSKGISGMLPAAYTLLAKRFLQAVEKSKKGREGKGDVEGKVAVREWRRGTVGEVEGWTYHAKGIWVALPSPPSAPSPNPALGPAITIIGSSNYTTRAHSLDLEANALVVTCDAGLQRRLAEEEAWLLEEAREVGLKEFERTERRVSVWVRISMAIVGAVGGAL